MRLLIRSRLTWIYSGCRSIFDFRLKPLFALVDMSKFQGWESPLQKLRDERVNDWIAWTKLHTRWYYSSSTKDLITKDVGNENRNTLAIYCIYPKYSDTSRPYHTCSKIWTSTIYYLMCLKIVWWVANSVDSDETHCVLCGVSSGSTLCVQACLSKYIR